jgi:hypothetical protein
MIKREGVQGGSDKSGIFFFFLFNGTTQLKTSRFIEVKKKISSYTFHNQHIQ